MAARATGSVQLVKRKRGDKWYMKVRYPSGKQAMKLVGPAWTERTRPILISGEPFSSNSADTFGAPITGSVCNSHSRFAKTPRRAKTNTATNVHARARLSASNAGTAAISRRLAIGIPALSLVAMVCAPHHPRPPIMLPFSLTTRRCQAGGP
jgi:hypothetical protein